MKGNKSTNKKLTKLSKVPKFKSYEEAGEFWDTHDLTEFETREVEITTDVKAVRCYVSVDPDLMNEVVKAAMKKGISSQTFVNLAIRERLAGQRK